MGMKYIGNGAYVPPFPARDLSDDEVKQFGAEQIIATGLYAPTDSEKTSKPVKTTKESEA